LNLAHVDTAWVGEISVTAGAAGRQGADAAAIERSVADSMKHLHVVNVMYKQTALETHDEPLKQTTDQNKATVDSRFHRQSRAAPSE